MSKPKYVPVEHMSRAEIVRDLAGDDPKRISDALYSATYHDPEWRWVQDECLKFLKHSDVRVRWTAATCLGDLAMFHKVLDLPRVVPEILEAAKEDAIRPAAEFSISLIKQKCRVQ